MNLESYIFRLFPWIKYFDKGRKMQRDKFFVETNSLTTIEKNKKPSRTAIINFILASLNRETYYLEIGTRNPEDNFLHIEADKKISVDPGYEFKQNPVDFKMTSDVFFEQLNNGKILDSNETFDVIFIDGLHLASQVNRDIANALKYIADDGFIILHDCNPPTQWHARETYEFHLSPAKRAWNGTTWKAFIKWRNNPELYSCCIDSDWGVGILSKQINIGLPLSSPMNEFYEFHEFNSNRKNLLGLISFEKFKSYFS